MDTRREPHEFHKDEHLDIDDLSPDPFTQFRAWFQAAHDADLAEPNSMVLATATADGIPSARTVLLKGFDSAGFVFFSNYESHKGRELAENPNAAVVFYWHPLGRQIRVAGRVERVTQDESFAYFSTRPRGSRIGAWASRQSEPLESRQFLLDRAQELDERYPGEDIPLPPHWGGYRLVPNMLEFWESRESRLHDRFRYSRADDGTWAVQRLQP